MKGLRKKAPALPRQRRGKPLQNLEKGYGYLELPTALILEKENALQSPKN